MPRKVNVPDSQHKVASTSRRTTRRVSHGTAQEAATNGIVNPAESRKRKREAEAVTSNVPLQHTECHKVGDFETKLQKSEPASPPLPVRSGSKTNTATPSRKSNGNAPVKSEKKRKAGRANIERPKPETTGSDPASKAAHSAVEQDTQPQKPAGKEAAKPAKRRRKTKEEKEKEAMPLAARTVGHRLAIGAHVSAAGGVQQAVKNSVHIGGNAFALFLKSQRKWENPALKSEHADEFKHLCQSHSYEQTKHVLPHGSYLVNLASADPTKAEQAYSSFLDDLKRCEVLGIKLYNFHPGNTNGAPRSEAIGRIASMLNRAHKATAHVVTVLENMAAAGNTIGGRFEDLRDVISLVHDKNRVGVCLDTAHALGSGLELGDPEGFKRTMSSFEDVIGIKYLRAVHLNDSKAPIGSHRDLHQNIGLGFVGLRGFHSLVNDPRFEGLPLVLETPIGVKDSNGKEIEDKSIWAQEIKLLESLVGMDPDGHEFKKLEKELADKGAEERSKHTEQFDRKQKKLNKGSATGRSRKKNHGEEATSSDSE